MFEAGADSTMPSDAALPVANSFLPHGRGQTPGASHPPLLTKRRRAFRDHRPIFKLLLPPFSQLLFLPLSLALSCSLSCLTLSCLTVCPSFHPLSSSPLVSLPGPPRSSTSSSSASPGPSCQQARGSSARRPPAGIARQPSAFPQGGGGPVVARSLATASSTTLFPLPDRLGRRGGGGGGGEGEGGG